MKKMKLVISMLGFLGLPLLGCKNSLSIIDDLIHDENTSFFIKGIGLMGKHIYIHQKDDDYVLYSRMKNWGEVVFKMHSKTRSPIILRVYINGQQVYAERVKSIDKNSMGFFVVFTKSVVYYLDFSSKKFGKYIRS